MAKVLGEPSVPWLIGVLLPVMLIFGVAALKKLVRGPGRPFTKSDMYQGIELCWAVLGAAVLYYYDSIRSYSEGAVTGEVLAVRVVSNTFLVIVACCVTLVVASQHQELESSANIRRQVWTLGVACNLVGVLLFVWFVVGIKEA